MSEYFLQSKNMPDHDRTFTGFHFRVFSAVYVTAVVFLLFLLVSCEAGSTGQTVLRFSRWAGIEESRRFQAIMDQFSLAHPEIKVETEYLPWDAYYEKLRISLQTGDAPDVFMLSNLQSDQFVLGGKLLPLDELDRNGIFTQFNDATKMPVDSGEHLYGIPVGLAIPVMFYNGALLDAAGIPRPSATEPLAWEEFLALLPPLRRKDSSGAPASYPLRISPENLAENLLNIRESPLYEDQVRQTSVSLTEESALKALDNLAEVYAQDLLPPLDWGEDARGFGTPDTALATGKVAFAYTGMWAIPLFKEAKLDWGTMPFPIAELRSPRGSINYLAVPASTTKQKAAWTLLEWFATTGQDLIAASGDYPANMYSNPVDLAGDIPSEVYQTVASEKVSMVPSLNIRNDRIRSLYNDMVKTVSRGTGSPKEALGYFMQEAAKITPQGD